METLKHFKSPNTGMLRKIVVISDLRNAVWVTGDHKPWARQQS
jgi:hypothetical protein